VEGVAMAEEGEGQAKKIKCKKMESFKILLWFCDL